MAHRRQSIKKIRIDKRRREVNIRVMSDLRTTAKKALAALQTKKAQAKTAGQELFSKLDKAVKKGRVHKNRASRLKSRFAKKLNAIK